MLSEKPHATRRGQAYQVFATALARELTGDDLPILRAAARQGAFVAGATGQTDLGEACAALAAAIPDLAQGTPTEADATILTVRVEFGRLFLGSRGIPLASPYESDYREDSPRARRTPLGQGEHPALLFGPAARTMRELLEEWGLSAAPGLGPQDHVATELSLLAYLVEREASAVTEQERQRAARDAATLLGQRLALWIPRFATRVSEAAQAPLYPALVVALAAFIRADHASIVEQPSPTPARAALPV